MADTRIGTDLRQSWEKRQHVKGTGLLAYCVDQFEDAKTKTRGRQRLPRGYLNRFFLSSFAGAGWVTRDLLT